MSPPHLWGWSSDGLATTFLGGRTDFPVGCLLRLQGRGREGGWAGLLFSPSSRPEETTRRTAFSFYFILAGNVHFKNQGFNVILNGTVLLGVYIFQKVLC
jgi:hypothetical protein